MEPIVKTAESPVQPQLTSPRPLVLVSANPTVLLFPANQSSPTSQWLHIINSSNVRIAWRVICNAPTRYVVSPNKGFLTAQEKIEVQVILVSSDKQHPKHAFIVQAKVAKPGENNRKQVWELKEKEKDDRALHNIRIATGLEGSGGTPSSRSSSTGSVASVTSNKDSSAISSVSNGSVAGADVSASITGSSASSSASSIQPIEQAEHGEYWAEIERVLALCRKEIASKDSNVARLVTEVNEVKRLEVQLDQVSQTLFHQEQMHEASKKNLEELRIRNKAQKEEIAVMKEELRMIPPK